MSLSALTKKLRRGILASCVSLVVLLPSQGFGQQAESQSTASTTPQVQAQENGGSAAGQPPSATVPSTKAATPAPPTVTPGEISQQISVKREKVLAALNQKDFSYTPDNMVDPFVSFIVTRTEPTEPVMPPEDEAEPPKPQMPLTPLQKMALGQIERGFRAVLWGDLGMRALIEDDAGKGYIVSVGTPLGGYNGVVTEIYNDRLIIQQQIWNPGLKQMVPRIVEVKLTKTAEKEKAAVIE
jgi:Tfp pilus assembly protein PilP